MKNTNSISLLLLGLVLLYYGLSDLDNFNILYNGLALIIGCGAILMAIIQYVRNK